MSENDPHLVDRLSERGLIDRWGFLLFAFCGAAGIIIAKSLGLSAIPVAAGAAITMVAYAAIIQMSGTGRLRADQAGDNCYYLGLIFTLSSLAYAIFLFDPANTATTIVQGFGIALTTTIIGLVLRVFFSQSRVDLVQTEDTARIELAEAAGRLKGELSTIVVSMNDFARQTRQSLEELHQEVRTTLTEVRDTAAKTISDTAAEANTAILDQSNQANIRAKRLTTATDKVVASIERHAEVFGDIEKSSGGIAASLAALETSAHTTEGSMKALVDRTVDLNAVQAGVKLSNQELSQVVAQLIENVRAFDTTASRFDQLVSARLAEVQDVPSNIASKTASDMAEAVEQVRGSMETIARLHVGLADTLASRVEESASLAGQHNAALERELSRSRENVEKVHSALVDMTGRLAERVERSPA